MRACIHISVDAAEAAAVSGFQTRVKSGAVTDHDLGYIGE